MFSDISELGDVYFSAFCTALFVGVCEKRRKRFFIYLLTLCIIRS